MTSGSSQGHKVEQIMRKWDLRELGDELERRWLGRGTDDYSLRELTEYFNRRILTEALTQSGTVPLEGEIENYYHLLTGEDVTKANEIQAKQRLTQLGIDSEDLSGDFISHQTMYRYLKNHRDVRKESSEQSTEDVIETVRRTSTRMSNKLKVIVQKNMEVLNNRSEFHIGEFDIYIDVQITCSECGTTRELKQLLERNGCDCR